MLRPKLTLPVPAHLNLEAVQAAYPGRDGTLPQYVGDLALAHPGQTAYESEPYFVFYQAQPAQPQYSHYFGLQLRGDGLTVPRRTVIVDAASVAEGVWNGLMHIGTGEIIFSRYRHHFLYDRTQNFAVDGGRDYFRIVGDTSMALPLRLTLVAGQFQAFFAPQILHLPEPEHGAALQTPSA